MNDLGKLEKKVTAFLQEYARSKESKEMIAPSVARASLLPNHLYEDLGFDNRMQMNRFMIEHFSNLAKMKPKDTLWKKFIYDSVGEVAPACEYCPDQETCFPCK
ncbi:MAG: nitrogen fixation protein NifQ [Sulfurovaceae bacterium]|jgi:nitrogen fixation protein NifQ